MPSLTLIEYDPDNQTHIAELSRQRIAVFWIHPGLNSDYEIPAVEPMSLDRSKAGPPPPDFHFQPLGHIGLAWSDHQGDESLANQKECRIMLSTFFILKSQQGCGLGRYAMDAIEARAALPPFSARTITLNTISARTQKDKAWCEAVGYAHGPNVAITEDWYARRGYKRYAYKLRYPWTVERTGEEIVLEGAFMEKELFPVE